MDYIDEKLKVLKASLDTSGQKLDLRRKASAELLRSLTAKVKAIGGSAPSVDDELHVALVPRTVIRIGLTQTNSLWIRIESGNAVYPELEFDGEKWIGRELDRDIQLMQGQRYQRKDALDVVVETMFELCRAAKLI